ncbi:MAG: HAD hydrolase family protein [Armatimonadetes bacterium]|nr:HAD hydrolase family protein [Armatimonadota bacterium]
MNWAAVKVVFCDVDGVMTDGGIYFGPEGQLFKRFNIHDGYGMRKLVEAGVKVIVISADDNEIVPARASRLKLSEVHMAIKDKAALVRQILARDGLAREEAVFIGDDEIDVPAMREVGIPVAVASAHPSAKAAAVYITERPGGHGAVREVCDLILAALTPNGSAG